MSTPPTTEDLDKLRLMLSLLNEKSQPNINGLTEAVRNIPWAHLNIKTFGYDLARSLVAALPVRHGLAPHHVGLTCRASLQADMESDWLAYWCGQLHSPVMFHRKLWELAYVLQAVRENGHLREGARGLGFGCGVEPLPSYFAAHGVSVTMTDLLPAEAEAAGWVATNQHAANVAMAFHPHLVTRERFDEKVELRYVDMNAIPADLDGYDFCWSICALEHLGSIGQGLAFVENTLATLKPGGLSVHTTEFNINAEGLTIDNWPTVLFQRRHVEALAARLREQGHDVAPLDFSLGDRPLDRFVDLPPFHHDLPPELAEWMGTPQHLKVAVDGFAATCFGLIVRKRAA
ncbi:Methyltransferase domain-containing protein [Sphingomonas gellani]|uniref:Methyltransferase domain-containing protein n=1 Tax=Sphingomonas gellani TaxID=1166340 RepID=A0A1H8I8E7_9SPHN|nr:methyltransferase domain-containing protein [Sphingomonas gellani]SEN64316.1 Methyltransferase domain-containing protein [Sphingomonas gellani]